jgi:hypothetical protein
MVRGIYISAPIDGRIYVAERSRKGSSKLLWSVMPAHDGPDVRIEAGNVPYRIRRQGYRHLGD